MPDLFIWYHADATLAPELRVWLQHVQSELGVQGSLYIRREISQTTFMEIFPLPHVKDDIASRIEDMARKTHCFDGIRRHCESFEKVKPDS